MPAPYRRLGRVVKVHGTSGEVLIASIGDLAESFQKGVDVWLVPPPASGAVARRIENVRQGPKGPLVRVTGVTTSAEAHEIVGRWLLTTGEESDERDTPDALIGMRVEDAERGDIGTVTDIIVTGANDVLVVEGGTYGAVLVPVIDHVILGIDLEARVLSVALLDGLIDGES